MFRKISGTRDLLPGEVEFWQEIEAKSRRIFSAYNYHEIRPPLIEEESLFNRSLGETAEIVQKQMFVIKRESDTYALRPEGTASIVRAYIENGLDKQRGAMKLFYMGPMFRAERPQKGRLRQFHQLGCEAIGSAGPDIDVEVIVLADALLKEFGVSGYTIVLNSLGCAQDKLAFNQFLKTALKDKLDSLCQDCRVRYDRNVLRILDCKNEACRNVAAGIHEGHSRLCADCRTHFDAVKSGLDSVGVKYDVSHNLVRGLDYYNRTVFEFKHGGLGPQQDAIGAGGRYDSLIEQLGGLDMPAVGFAFGIERLLLAKESPEGQAGAGASLDAFIVPLGDAARAETAKLAFFLRGTGGISADTALNYSCQSMKSAMRKANDLGARFAIIIGDDELRDGVIAVKDMASGEQVKLEKAKAVEYIRKTLDN
jgi:histidyl-tRNA synthetase